MKIESVDFFYLSMPTVTDAADGSQDALLVRVRAGDQEGWGECEGSPLPCIAAWCTPMSHGACRPVADSVLGMPLDEPDDIRRITTLVRDQSLDLLQAAHTLSGIDMALWDLLARARDVPIHTLLGATSAHPKLPYASVLFGDTPEETLARGRECQAAGFGAVKFGWGPFGRGSVDEDLALAAAAREGIGDDRYLMIDVGTRWLDDVDALEQRARGLADLDVTWIEEPFRSHELSAYAQAAAIEPHVALATGEGAHEPAIAEQLIRHGHIDFVQIDAGRIGGITAARQVAEFTRDYPVQYVNHSFTSSLALAASLAPYWDLEDSRFCEYPFAPSSLCREMTTTRIEVGADGLVHPPEAPGLGVTPDEDALQRYRVPLEITVDGRTVFSG